MTDKPKPAQADPDKTPPERLANSDVYDDWLRKPSWTLMEAAALIAGYHPEYGLLDYTTDHPNDPTFDTLERAVTTSGKRGLKPTQPNAPQEDWRFRPGDILDAARTFEIALPDQLVAAVASPKTRAATAALKLQFFEAALAAVARNPNAFRTKGGTFQAKPLADFLDDQCYKIWGAHEAPRKPGTTMQWFSDALKTHKNLIVK